MGNFYCNSTGFAITSGMTSAVDTLSSQAFGARNFRRIGVVAQRAVAVLGTLALAQSLLWLRADWILSHLGQDAEVVALATRFVAVRVPELWAVVLFEVIKRSLQAQGIVRPPLAATALTIPLHIALSYTLTYHTSLGFWGAAVASICTRLLQAAGMLVYVLWRGDALTVVTVGHIARMAAEQEREAPPLDLAGQDASARGQYAPVGAPRPDSPPATTPAPSETQGAGPALAQPTPPQLKAMSQRQLLELPHGTPLGRTWEGCSCSEAFSGWWQFIRLGVPGGIMAALDWASFEALAVIAGALGVKQLAAHTIVAQVATLSFLIPYGFAIAVSVRVGQAMGRADPSTGKRAAAVGTAAALAWGALNFLVVLPTAGLWPRAFTSDAEVIALASTAAVGVACFSTLDALQQVVVGTLKGVGQQCIGAVVYPLAYLGAGIPLAFALAHPAGWGLLGVWGGESIGAALAVFTLGGLLAFWFDWAAMARKARAAALAGVQAPAPVVEVELADASQAGPPPAP